MSTGTLKCFLRQTNITSQVKNVMIPTTLCYQDRYPYEHHRTQMLLSISKIQRAFISTTSKHLQQRYNKGLESVKEQGQSILESIVSDIQSKTKRHLLIEDEDNGPTIYQLKEAAKLKRLVEDAVDNYMSKHGDVFCILKEPIAIVDVEVTEDLRQARVFWSLPYSIFLMGDKAMDSRMRQELGVRMQRILDERGGALQGFVHTRLRSYFRPPKIRFVRAEDEMIRRTLREML